VRESEEKDSDQQEDLDYPEDTEAQREKQRMDDISEAEKEQALRMVYEDDLRKVCEERAIDQKQQQLWMSIRKSLPISRWIERTRDKHTGKSEQKELKAELARYLEIFAGEAKENGLELDMECNYYREAVSLLSKYRQGEMPEESDRKKLKELMIMVDYKDAKLALQILQSII
jgi:hypothetical protein